MRSRVLACISILLSACTLTDTGRHADILLVQARVYSFAWDDPSQAGEPAANAPHGPDGWRPDAEAIAILGERILYVGSEVEARRLAGSSTEVIDLHGATVIPGLIESHTHVAELGRKLAMVDLTHVRDEQEAISRVQAFAVGIPKGEWILGNGWDEGAWADRYPSMARLSQAFPENPVLLRGLHGFAVWGNAAAFAAAGIDRDTSAPSGGEIIRDTAGNPSGILTNRATELLSSAVPPADLATRQREILAGLQALARSGYVAVHEAGVDRETLQALQSLADQGRLPLHVYAMLSARDRDLARAWLARGPQLKAVGKLQVRSVKAFFDGALGSRGAALLEDYADRPGHRGVAGEEYQFDRALLAEMMRAGFQVCIHAIGDAGNRQTLDFIESVQGPEDRGLRHRIEHAQVLHAEDIGRFAELGVIASMQPPHAMEDMVWAEARLGPVRVRGAYAWRSLRQQAARLCFNSDLPGSDHDIFYGIHSALTRRGKDSQPRDGWYAEQCMSIEESLRGYSSWGAYAGFAEGVTGKLAEGYRADISVMDIDPLVLAQDHPAEILDGKILMTMVAGKIIYRR